MLSKKNVWTPQEILREMQLKTPLGREHLEIVKHAMIVEGFEMPTDEQAIEFFKSAFGLDRRFLRLGRNNYLIVSLDANLMAFRPDFERATKWGAWWIEDQFNRVAEAKGFNVLDLYASQCTRQNFFNTIPKAKYGSFLGHGSETEFTGQNYERVLKYGDSESSKIMQGKAGNFLSCKVGAILLPWLAENGAAMLHGYFVTYYFVINPNAFPNSYAKWFFMAHHTFDKLILEGKKAEEAHKMTYDKYTEFYKSSEVPWAAKIYLVHDRDGMKLFGDPDWRLEGETPPPPPSKWKPSQATLTLVVLAEGRPTKVLLERYKIEAYPGETIYLKGRVVDAENEQYGVPYPKVQLMYGDELLDEATGDNDGNFELKFKVNFEPGTYELLTKFTGEAGE